MRGGPLRLLAEAVQNVDRLRPGRRVDRPECPGRIAHPDLADTRSDRRHRLPVVRIVSTLDAEQLVTGVVHGAGRKGHEIGLRAAEPDDRLHWRRIAGQASPCKIVHKCRYCPGRGCRQLARGGRRTPAPELPWTSGFARRRSLGAGAQSGRSDTAAAGPGRWAPPSGLWIPAAGASPAWS